MNKKIFIGAAVYCALSVSAFSAPLTYNFKDSKAVKDKKQVEFNNISVKEAVFDMETGWNLGNTMDANGSKGLSSENSWGHVTTTKEMIDFLAESGIKTIRIPTSWANHIIDKNYTIDPKWMSRVKTIVDWAIEDGMYVILNTHHDNYPSNSQMPHCAGYYPNPLNENESRLFIKNVWGQIALAFNNGYDEHLVFEIMNEPRLRGHGHEWGYNSSCNECKYAAKTINKLNQLGVDAIRQSGGNNAKRFIMVSGIAASLDVYIQNPQIFEFPKDIEGNDQRFILSVHIYAPYEFAMKNPGVTELQDYHLEEISYYFEELDRLFCQKGYPVVIGEYGATNKNNLEDRVAWYTHFITETRKFGMTSVMWDNGDANANNTFEEKFGFFDRENLQWYFPEIIEAIVRSVKVDE